MATGATSQNSGSGDDALAASPPATHTEFQGLEQVLGYSFRRRELLLTALTHSSHAHERGNHANASVAGQSGRPGADNERLEFLGDAVLGLVTSEELIARFPDLQEGQLSKIRAHLVSQHHLVRVAERLSLGSYLRLGRGEEKSGGRHKAALLVDALEAILGAMYLDGGLDVVRPFVKQSVLAQELEARFSDAHLLSTTDYKSALQEAAHASGRVQPSYVLVQEEGPPHQKLFTVEVRLHRGTRRGRAEYVARAKGPSKKTAEQNAARDALSYLQTHNAPAESTSNGPRRRIIKGGHDE